MTNSPEINSLESSSPEGGPGLPSILFVDDDPEVRFLLENTLEEVFEIVSAESAKEALSILGSEEPGGGGAVGRKPAFENGVPDLFLLDIRMPDGRNGLELLRFIRKFRLAEEVPAVALTTYAGPEEREVLLEEGFDEHVSKPFRREELIGALRRALRTAGARTAEGEATDRGTADTR